MAQNFVKDLDQVYQHPQGILEKVVKLVKEVASNVDQEILNKSFIELVADIDKNVADLRNCEMDRHLLNRKLDKTAAKCEMLNFFGTIKSMISEYYNNPISSSLENYNNQPILKMNECIEALWKTLGSVELRYRAELYGAPLISPTRSPVARGSDNTNSPPPTDSPPGVAASDAIDTTSPDHFSTFNVKKMPDNFTDEFPLKRFALSEQNIEKVVVERLFGGHAPDMNEFLERFIKILDNLRGALGWYKTEIEGLNVDEVTIVQPIVYGFQRLLIESYLRDFSAKYGFNMDPKDLRNINSVHLEAKLPLQGGKPPMEYAGNGDIGFLREYEKRWSSANPLQRCLWDVLYEIKTCFKNLQSKDAKAVAEQSQLLITMFSVLNEFLLYQKDIINSTSAGAVCASDVAVERETTQSNDVEPTSSEMPSSAPSTLSVVPPHTEEQREVVKLANIAQFYGWQLGQSAHVLGFLTDLYTGIIAMGKYKDGKYEFGLTAKPQSCINSRHYVLILLFLICDSPENLINGPISERNSVETITVDEHNNPIMERTSTMADLTNHLTGKANTSLGVSGSKRTLGQTEDIESEYECGHDDQSGYDDYYHNPAISAVRSKHNFTKNQGLTTRDHRYVVAKLVEVASKLVPMTTAVQSNVGNNL